MAIRDSLFPKVPTDPSPSPPTKLPAEGHERGEKQKTSGLQHEVIQQRSLAGKTKTCDSVTSSGKWLTLPSVEGKAVLVLPPMPPTKWQQCPHLPHSFQTKEEKWTRFPLASLDIILPFKGSKANQSRACLSYDLRRRSSKGLWKGVGWLGAQSSRL